MKRNLVLTSFPAMVALVATLSLLSIQGDTASAQSPEAPMPPPEVSFITVETADVPQNLRLPGRTMAYNYSEVRPQVGGILKQRLFEEGAVVEQGQALYQIDSAIYEANVLSAEAQLETARANAGAVKLRADRYARLVQSDAISEQDNDDIQAQLAQSEAAIRVAEAALETARINLEYTRVYAPISGQISQSLVSEGALVTANQPQALAVITQLDPIYVDLMQSSAEHMQMRAVLSADREIPVSLELDGAATLGQFQGKLQFSSVYVQPGTGSVQLRALFPNPDHILLPGLFVHASLELGSQRAILLPQRATQRDANGTLSAWRLGRDNTVEPVTVIAEGEVGDQWLITSGLQAGDRVVMEGFQKIAPGAQVAAVPY